MLTPKLAGGVIAATLLASASWAQAPSPGPKTVQMVDKGLFDFDDGQEGDRQSADLRLNKSQDGTFFLEPLNGAGIGYLETSEKAAATCKSGKAGLRASRINASTPEKGTQLCLRTSDDEAYVFTLGDKSGTGLTISQYNPVGNNSETPPAADQNRIVYKLRPVDGDDESSPVAAQATDQSLTFQTRIVLSNVMPEVESARLTCSIAGDATANGVAVTSGMNGYSAILALSEEARRNSTTTVETEIDLPPGYDLDAALYYNCALILFIGYNDSGRPVPQSEVVGNGVEPWRGYRGEDADDAPWRLSLIELDAENAVYNRGGVVKTPDIRFNGMAMPGMVATPVEPDEPAPELPDVETHVGTLTEILECPSASLVMNDPAYNQGQNEAGWHTRYQKYGVSGGTEFAASPSFFMTGASLENDGRTLTCNYQELSSVEVRTRGRNTVEVASEGFGVFLSRTGDGACSPVRPSDWDGGVCNGSPDTWSYPRCPSVSDGFFDGSCLRSTSATCAVECPRFPAGD